MRLNILTVAVRNAHYIPVQVHVELRLRSGYDAGLYEQKVTDDFHQRVDAQGQLNHRHEDFQYCRREFSLLL